MLPRRSRFVLLASLVALGVCACVALQSGTRNASATRPATTTTAPSGVPLTITVKDLRNKKGDVVFGVFTQADGFPNVESKAAFWEVKSAGADALVFTTRLPPGRYAAGVLHDENRSGDMEKTFAGIPVEGYGVTNNPKPRLRKATFEEATFDLPTEGAELTISLQYF